MPPAPLKTFIIYARADERHKNQLLLHLKPLTRRGLIDVWHDGAILPGEDWKERIEAELAQSDLVLLLVSVNSLNSHFIQEKELKTALDRLRQGAARVVPIIVSHCGWKHDPMLSGLQAEPLYSGKGPMAVEDTIWSSADQAWTQVVDGLGDLALQLYKEQEAMRRRLKEAERRRNQSARKAEQVQRDQEATTLKAEMDRQAHEDAARLREEEERQSHEADWRHACTLHTIAAYNAFLNKWPNSPYAIETQRLIHLVKSSKKISAPWKQYTGVTGGVLVVLFMIYFFNPPLSEKGSAYPQPEVVLVEGSNYQMGGQGGQIDEKPLHQATLSNFYLGKYEVTIGEYLAFCDETKGNHPVWLEPGNNYHIETGSNDYYKRIGMSRENRSHPMTGVTWNNALAYCQWLSRKTGQIWRLPSEAEWEYASRGGKQGAQNDFIYAGSNNLDEVGWSGENSDSKAHQIGGKKPNQLGLYDMSGNVYEWCADWYGDYPSGPVNNPTGPKEGSSRVLRGGSWNDDPDGCRVANRNCYTPEGHNTNYGFRVARSLH